VSILGSFDPDSFRWGSSSAPLFETLALMFVVTVMAAACVLILIHQGRRRRRPQPVSDQWQALAVMGELCPHGWQAQITVYGSAAPVPEDAPGARTPLVELEWKQFDRQPGRVAVARRAWAPSAEEALETMVEDRRTDIALEQIEQEAAGEEDNWWSDRRARS